MRYARFLSEYQLKKVHSSYIVMELWPVVTRGPQKCHVEDILCGNRKLGDTLGRAGCEAASYYGAAYANRATLGAATDACFSCAFRRNGREKASFVALAICYISSHFSNTPCFDCGDCSLNSAIILCIKCFVTIIC